MWTQEKPRNPGYYWFFGWLFGKDPSPAKLEMIEINKFGMLVGHGAFLSMESTFGWFYECPEPPPPPEDMRKWYIEQR